MTEKRDCLAHNDIRFTITLGHIHEIFGDGDTTKKKLVSAIRKAIVQAIANEVKLRPQSLCGPFFYPNDSTTAMHDENIDYDFS